MSATTLSPPATRTLCLPVAPKAFARSCFAATMDGGVGLPPAVPPAMAFKWLEQQLAHNSAVAMVEIHGPGDPLAELEPTLETLLLIHEHFPQLNLSLRTLGIGAAEAVESLVRHGLRHVTLLVDAVDPVVLQQLYSWIRPGKHTLPLARAAVTLAEEQQRAVPALVPAGCTVELAVTVYPGINDGEIEGIAKRMAALGATSMSIAPGRVTGEDATTIITADNALLERLAKSARGYLGAVSIQTTHHTTLAPDLGAISPKDRAALPRPTAQRPNVAVASANGMAIDLHLGQAMQLLVYGPRDDGLTCILEQRPAPPGSGTPRWEAMAATLSDCFVVLASSAGDNPRKVLAAHGIRVLESEGDIAATVDVLYGGGKKNTGCRQK